MAQRVGLRAEARHVCTLVVGCWLMGSWRVGVHNRDKQGWLKDGGTGCFCQASCLLTAVVTCWGTGDHVTGELACSDAKPSRWDKCDETDAPAASFVKRTPSTRLCVGAEL